MSKHKPNYLVMLGILTVLFSAPWAYFAFGIGRGVFLSVNQGYRILIIPMIPGLTSNNVSYSDFNYATLWKNRFLEIQPDFQKINAANFRGVSRTVDDWKVALVDPETGDSKETGWEEAAYIGNISSREALGFPLLAPAASATPGSRA